MAKSKSKKQKSTWYCTECGTTCSGWFGRCPSCGAWNSIEEQTTLESTEGGRHRLNLGNSANVAQSSTKAKEESDKQLRLSSGVHEFDRVLGGGLVPGSIVLLGGSPGVGKSTLLLQACHGWADSHGTLLYASGEESVAQIGNRATRLGAAHDDLMLLAETRLDAILEQAEHLNPALMVVDSIQTVYCDDQDGLPGNLSQIRAVTARLLSWSKSRGTPIVVVGHVTKDGQLAGPRLLEHMVDAVLSFEGDEERSLRLLRATKNRFGSTQELGVFEMAGDGLREIPNPSEAFLHDRPDNAVGSCVTASLEGSRPLLMEVQALLGLVQVGTLGERA